MVVPKVAAARAGVALFVAIACVQPETKATSTPEDSAAETGVDCVPSEEACNDLDDDCDGEVDESGGAVWYPDVDGDGYGDEAAPGETCEAPAEAIAVGGDCDDEDSAVFPGAADSWYDGVDSNCDGASDFDQDGDGEDAREGGGEDCLDLAAHIGAERCRNVVYTQAGRLWEMTPEGETVGTWLIEHPDMEYMYARGVRVDALGRFVLFNGDSRSGPHTYVSVFDETTEAWTHIGGPEGWSIGDNGSYGELAVWEATAWAPDPSGSRGAPETGSLVRADLTTGVAEAVLGGRGYLTANLGLDGLIYALDGWTAFSVDVIDPETATVLRTIDLDYDEDARSLAADADGRLWTADWDNRVLIHDMDGLVVEAVDIGVGDLTSIDLAEDGRVVIGARSGELVFSDTTLVDLTVFQGGDRDDIVFVSWIAR